MEKLHAEPSRQRRACAQKRRPEKVTAGRSAFFLLRLRGGRLGVIDWASLSGGFDWVVERLAIKVGQKSNKITSLSGGNKQEVLIGRSFAVQPNILVLDDPARGSDV